MVALENFGFSEEEDILKILNDHENYTDVQEKGKWIYINLPFSSVSNLLYIGNKKEEIFDYTIANKASSKCLVKTEEWVVPPTGEVFPLLRVLATKEDIPLNVVATNAYYNDIGLNKKMEVQLSAFPVFPVSIYSSSEIEEDGMAKESIIPSGTFPPYDSNEDFEETSLAIIKAKVTSNPQKVKNFIANNDYYVFSAKSLGLKFDVAVTEDTIENGKLPKIGEYIAGEFLLYGIFSNNKSIN